VKGKQAIKHVKQKLKTINIWKKGSKTEAIHVIEEAKLDEIKLGFLGRTMHTYEQPCVRIIKPVCIGKIMHMWVSA